MTETCGNRLLKLKPRVEEPEPGGCPAAPPSVLSLSPQVTAALRLAAGRKSFGTPRGSGTAAALFFSSAVAFSFFSSSFPLSPPAEISHSLPLSHASAQDPPTPAPKALTPECPKAPPLAPKVPKKEQGLSRQRLIDQRQGILPVAPTLYKTS